jgi:hypothetical protein
MEDFPHITNEDEYIGFLFGIMSSDNDIETIFLDGIISEAKGLGIETLTPDELAEMRSLEASQ